MENLTSLPAAAEMQYRLGLARAALVSTFDPHTLLDPTSSNDDWLVAIERLAEDCAEVHVSGGLRWRLLVPVRQAALQDLHERGQLANVMQEWSDPTDPLSFWLKTLIEDTPIELSSLAPSDLDVLRTAASLLFFLPQTRPLLVDWQIEHRARVDGIQLLRSGGVVGRESQLRRMLKFAENAGRTAAATTLSLTGPGGSGKSALLAEFVHRLEQQLPNAVWVWMDFDAVTMVNGGAAVWLAELARQLGLANSAWASRAESFRQEAGRISGASAKQQSYQERVSISKTIGSLWHSLWSDMLRERSIVLILDTLEEIAVRTDEVANTLDDWLGSLMYQYDVRNLRLVLAGRVVPDLLLNEVLGVAAIKLENLPKAAAAKLLRRELDRHSTNSLRLNTRSVVERCGSNPLVIKLIAKWLARDPEQALDAIQEGGLRHADPAMIQRLLYHRILKRMRTEPAIIKLACPGLVLRRVTVDLIQSVLAVPCGLGPVSQEDSKRLFALLADQVWLVQHEGSGTLVHRRDLRQLMLPLIAADDPEKYAEIHRAAAHYYAGGKAAELPSERQRLESQYHLLMAGGPIDFHSVHAESLLASIGSDIDSVPNELAARLKAASDRSLSARELAQLDKSSASEYLERKAERSYKSSGIPEKIPRLELIGQTGKTPRPDGNSVLRAFDNADFEHVADIAPALFIRAFDEAFKGRFGREKHNLTESSLWKAALAVLTLGNVKQLANLIEERLYSSSRNGQFSARFNSASRQKLTFGDAMITMLELLGGIRGIRPPEPWQQYQSKIITLDEFRIAQLDPEARQRFFRPGREIGWQFLQFMDTDFRKYLRNLPDPETLVSESDIFEGKFGNAATLSKIKALEGRTLILHNMPIGTANHSLFFPGMLPELHTVVRGILSAERLTVTAEFPFDMPKGPPSGWPEELKGVRFARAMKQDANGWLSILVETADRFGLLRQLLCSGGISNSRRRQVVALLNAMEGRFRALN